MLKFLLFFLITSLAYSKCRPNWQNNKCKTEDGCIYNTRECVLLRDGKNIKKENCKIIGGEWKTYYLEIIITDPSLIDIDHIFPSSLFEECKDNKATEKYQEMYNDLSNLVVSYKYYNRMKSDSLELPKAFIISETKLLDFKTKQCNFCNYYKIQNCNICK